ncbi:MAG: hypothetical protein AABW58_01075 [Nanoarchaeota archaeon]
MFPIISSKELREILKAIQESKEEIEISLDLNLTKTKVKLDKEGFYLNNKLVKLKKIKETDKSCYLVRNNQLEKVQYFSDGKFYKLVPTNFRPILKISSNSMHKKEFLNQLRKDKLKGLILDSGTGLGYSSIIASKTAEKVITVEIDKNVLEIAKLNPYSKDLFSSKNIKIILGNIVEEIKKFPSKEFNNIIFDAGTVKGSEEFFSLNNYKEAFRVLKFRGKLYHYLPKHQIKRGRDFASEVISRLKSAGFRRVYRNKENSYIIAEKF